MIRGWITLALVALGLSMAVAAPMLASGGPPNRSEPRPSDLQFEILAAFEANDEDRALAALAHVRSTRSAMHAEFPATATRVALVASGGDPYWLCHAITSHSHGHGQAITSSNYGGDYRGHHEAREECFDHATTIADGATSTAEAEAATDTPTPTSTSTPTSTPTQVPVVHTVIVEVEVVVTATPTPCVEPTIDPARVDEHRTCPAPNPDESAE